MNNQKTETETFFNINNPAIIKHKERPPKRLKSNAEKSIFKQGKQVLRDSINIIEEVAFFNTSILYYNFSIYYFKIIL